MTASPDQVRLDRIGQIAIPVKDLARAVSFYRDRLGMRFLFEAPGLAFFDCGGVRLMLGLPEGAGSDRASSILYYRVEDLGESHRLLSADGVRVIEGPHLIARMPDHELWMAFFEDSEGNTFALMSEIREAARAGA